MDQNARKTPRNITTLVNKLNFNGMNEYGENLFPGTVPELSNIDSHIKSHLNHIFYITESLPYQSKTIPLEDYLKDVKLLRKPTSCVPSDATPTMVKTKALNLKIG